MTLRERLRSHAHFTADVRPHGKDITVDGYSFALLVAGLLMTIAGWFFDRLAHFPALGRWLARNAYDALDALALLAQDDRHALVAAHPGFPVIVSAWPGLDAPSSAKTIARSFAFVQFGGQVSNDFELIARGADNGELSPRWRHAAAAKEFQSRIDKQVFWYGTVVFWIGIAVALTAGLVDLFAKP